MSENNFFNLINRKKNSETTDNAKNESLPNN